MLTMVLPLATLAAALAAQAPARAPGPPAPARFDGRLLAQRTDTFAQYYIRGTDTTRVGSAIAMIRSDGTLLTYTYEDDDAISAQHDTIVNQLDGLLPVSHRHDSDASARLRYSRQGVSGMMVLLNGDSLDISVRLPVPTYNAASFDLIVRAADLRAGFRLDIAGYQFGSGGTVPLRGRVTGVDTVDGRPCWVFRGTNGVVPVTFWVDQGDRALRRQLIQLGKTTYHLMQSLPPDEAQITAAEKAGLVLTMGTARHALFDFVVPLPSPRFVHDTALQRQTNEAFDAPGFFGWVLRDPAEASGGLFIRVYKGFDGTQAGLRRFVRDIFKMDFSAKSWQVYEDSVYWDDTRREYRASVRDSRNIYYQMRCLTSPPPRSPALVACVLAISLKKEERDESVRGLSFGRTPE